MLLKLHLSLAPKSKSLTIPEKTKLKRTLLVHDFSHFTIISKYIIFKF